MWSTKGDNLCCGNRRVIVAIAKNDGIRYRMVRVATEGLGVATLELQLQLTEQFPSQYDVDFAKKYFKSPSPFQLET